MQTESIYIDKHEKLTSNTTKQDQMAKWHRKEKGLLLEFLGTPKC